jgi:hypothetical protein
MRLVIPDRAAWIVSVDRMSAPEFIAAMTGASAWPAATVTVAVVIRLGADGASARFLVLGRTVRVADV